MTYGGPSGRTRSDLGAPRAQGRGPKPAFTRADIAAAAVRLADAGGLEAVSMRHIAAELGCGTMSLYNYVPVRRTCTS